MRVVIVAQNASSRFGGEAFIPLVYFRLLRARGVDVRLVVHGRNKVELEGEFPAEIDRIYFVEDTQFHKSLNQLGSFIPKRLADSTTGLLIHFSTQIAQRRLIRTLVRDHNIDVVHEPIPVSPKIPSQMWNLGAGLVIGPLNGGMEYPDAFQQERGAMGRLAMHAGRRLANLLNFAIPGKRKAQLILVANRRTRRALPNGLKGRIDELVENGVDFSVWQNTAAVPKIDGPTRFVFVGRLVDWKSLEIIIEAARRIKDEINLSLEIIGDGPMRGEWEALVKRLGLSSNVQFLGLLPQRQCAARLQQADVFLLPSIFECGGAVVLEAMAMALPVIATAWGGPEDYLDESCGILVPPVSREALTDGFAIAMKALAESPVVRERLGQCGLQRARQHFDWERKIDRVLEFYASVARAS